MNKKSIMSSYHILNLLLAFIFVPAIYGQVSPAALTDSNSAGYGNVKVAIQANQVLNEEPGNNAVPQNSEERIAVLHTDTHSGNVIRDIALGKAKAIFQGAKTVMINNINLQDITISVHDSKGRLLFARKYGPETNRVVIHTGAYAPGAYICNAKLGTDVLSKTFIVRN